MYIHLRKNSGIEEAKMEKWSSTVEYKRFALRQPLIALIEIHYTLAVPLLSQVLVSTWHNPFTLTHCRGL